MKIVRIELLETRQVVHYVKVDDDADIFEIESDLQERGINTERFKRNMDGRWKVDIENTESKDFEMDLDEFVNDYFI